MKYYVDKKYIENLIENSNNDNANLGYNPEVIAKYVHDNIMKQYALDIMPKEVAEAHDSAMLHVHDAEYYALRPNCFNYDLRFFLKNGLIIDGKGVDGSVASPARSLEVLLNHLLQAFMAGAQVFSGGQGFANFNTFLAPLCRGRSYYDIKQCIQGFIFNCNMSLVAKGGQCIFTSVGLDMSVPNHLKDVPAVIFEGETIGEYKDYQREADMIFKAFLEVLNEKDASGQWHRFPNTLINIQNGDLDEYKGTCKILHELGANNPTLYYTNQSNYVKSIMGCRTALPDNFTGVYDLDCLNTGNFAYTTLNLPLLALEAEGNVDRFYGLLDKYCDIARKGLLNRREIVKDVIYNKHMSDFLLQRDKVTGIPLYDIDRTTITIGFCGLYECMKILNYNFGENIIQFINNKTAEYKRDDGLRWSVIASPAESASHRFAMIIKDKYPEVELQGTDGYFYLTNSSHIPVSHESDIVAHIKNADKFHPLTKGGNILHVFLGESYHDPIAIWKLNKKILDTNTNFWALTTNFSYCNCCHNTFNEALEECSICGSDDLTVYSRITGYFVPVKNWNNGKKAEFKDRYLHGGI
jgi:ribonucleoside-triphosphate reductase